MKAYVKPALEVISMKTSENIADNLFKTIYTMTTSSNGAYTTASVDEYDPTADLGGALS